MTTEAQPLGVNEAVAFQLSLFRLAVVAHEGALGKSSQAEHALEELACKVTLRSGQSN